ncbi:MAG: hypothetical protein O4861_20435 [Trichodesmium sp. St16_bin4-tuft]|nr:hypothetical protein [Trichodesmium sp. MAG_R01]MDE5074157.1 hypothetical protein [Trichodesmium sp. St5_bin8]MDE5078043.1 hypothetical protein [Trichodesmium sp. St2_bin6]MDE5100571.1 hypothetical protein [Trichodesmium sp. St16_bin4-tuft]MDE5104190.1 hypothetical protein [Trichodesmium sp. St19_bin2]
MIRVEKKEDTVVFLLELSCIPWAVNDDFVWKLVEILMILNYHKFRYYRKGIKAINKLFNK